MIVRVLGSTISTADPLQPLQSSGTKEELFCLKYEETVSEAVGDSFEFVSGA